MAEIGNGLSAVGAEPANAFSHRPLFPFEDAIGVEAMSAPEGTDALIISVESAQADRAKTIDVEGCCAAQSAF